MPHDRIPGIVLYLVALIAGASSVEAAGVVYSEDFDEAAVKAGQSVTEAPLGWKLLSPNEPAKARVGDVFLGAGEYGWKGNYLEGKTAAVPEAENVFQKTFPVITSGQVVLSCRAFAAGETSAVSSVSLAAAQARYSNRGGGWISTPTGWAFWVGWADSSSYPLGDQKLGPYQVLQEPLEGAHDVPIDLKVIVDLDSAKAWGEAHWTDAQGKDQSFKSKTLDWDTSAGNLGSIVISMDRRNGHTGIALDDLRVEGEPASAKPHSFGKTQHAVRRLNGEKESTSLPAEMQWISQSWNGENAQMPYLVYMPEKDRLLMLVECGQPIHSALLTSDDHGQTWSSRRWLSVDGAGNPNAAALGLTYLGGGVLWAYPEDLKVCWVSTDYGETWKEQAFKARPEERYTWDPLLVVPNASGRAKRLVQAWWKPTGIPWGSAEAPYSQAYLRSSPDAGQSWSDDARVPQWLGVNEVAMLRAANGDWVAACRTDNPKRFAHHAFDHYSGLAVSISKDEGKTWSDMKELYEWGRHHPSMVLLPDGGILMTYAVRLGYPNTSDGFPQFGVEAVLSRDHGQTWDLAHRTILAEWVGNLKGENFWYGSVQSSSTVLLPDSTILTAFGTGFSNTPDTERCKMDVALVKWKIE